MIPQLIMLSLYMLDIGINLAKHGELKTERYNFFTTLFGALLGILILYCGGFFEVFNGK